MYCGRPKFAVLLAGVLSADLSVASILQLLGAKARYHASRLLGPLGERRYKPWTGETILVELQCIAEPKRHRPNLFGVEKRQKLLEGLTVQTICV
jgi:hypothetical protein